MRSRFPGARGALVTLLALVLPLVASACGTYSSHTDPIFRGVVGPAGGTVAAGPVTLIVAPGALLTDLSIAIFPQPDPLPIDPNAGEVEYLPGLHCIGPVAHVLAQPCVVRVCYDPDDVPAGATLDDLVLLEWDDAAQLMRVRAGAVHDTVGHCFEDTFYGVLGHIGVGVVVGGPPPDFDFFLSAAPEVTEQGRPTAGPLLLLGDSTGALDPVVVDGTEDATNYLASRDGSRILFEVFDNFQKTSSLATVLVAPTGPFTPTPLLGGSAYSSGSPLVGWHGGNDAVYHEHYLVAAAGGSQPTTAFATVPGAGGAVTDVRTRGGTTFLQDVRYARDRSKVLLRWVEFGKGTFHHVDVVDVATGQLIGEDLPTATDDADVTPRWLPDSTGVYFVEDDGVTVTRLDPDGTNPTTLYTLPTANSALLDFVVSSEFEPAPQRCAYVRRDFGFAVDLQGVGGGPNCFYETDALTGGDLKSLDLVGDFQVVELAAMYSDAWNTSLVLLELTDFSQTQGVGSPLPNPVGGKTLVMGEDDPGLWTVVPVSLGNVDLHNGHGRALVTIDQPDVNFPAYPTAGVYETDPFFGNPTLVTPPGYVALRPARWLRSWRFSSGLYTSLVR